MTNNDIYTGTLISDLMALVDAQMGLIRQQQDYIRLLQNPVITRAFVEDDMERDRR